LQSSRDLSDRSGADGAVPLGKSDPAGALELEDAKGPGRSAKSSSLAGRPEIDAVMLSRPTSTMVPSKMLTTSMTWLRISGVARTLTSSSSRSTASLGSSSVIFRTSMSLNSCLVICSRGVESTSTTMVMRLSAGSSVGATARDSMLYARRANSDDTRARTPARFCTRTDRMWSLGCWLSAISCPSRRGR
jgi:hypothetical protein